MKKWIVEVNGYTSVEVLYHGLGDRTLRLLVSLQCRHFYVKISDKILISRTQSSVFPLRGLISFSLLLSLYYWRRDMDAGTYSTYISPLGGQSF